MAPVLASSTPVQITAANLTSLVTSAITVNNGDVLVVKSGSEAQIVVGGTPTAPGQTFTSRKAVSVSGYSWAGCSTAVVTGSPGTLVVTQAWSGTSGQHEMLVERWTGAQLAGTPATNTTVTVSSTGFSGTLTTVAANSVVSWIAIDTNTNTPGTVGYRSSATQEQVTTPGNYVGYFAYQAAAVSGAQTFGTTTPTGAAWSFIGIEIEAAAAAPDYPFGTTTPTPRYR